MMSPRTATIASLICSLCLPMTAHAYLTPDEVLNEGDFSTRFYEPPPSKREVEERVEEQQERSAERREAEQAALQGDDEEEPTHGAAPDESSDSDSDFDEFMEAFQEWQDMQNGDDEPTHDAAPDEPVDADAVEQRLLNRLRERDEDGRAAAYEAWIMGQQGQTHGGAPLSQTGPATVVAVIIGALAIGETWRRVRKMDRR